MSAPLPTRRLDARLATYLAIFFAAYLASAVLALMFAEMNVMASDLRSFQILVPLGVLTAVGVAAYTNDLSAYFVAERGVPPFFSGLGMAVIAFGAAGLTGLTGTIFILGVDGLLIGLGLLLGVMALAIAIAPFYRKDGAYTLAGFLGRRFESRAIRMTAALLLAPPLLMLAVAELKLATWLLSRLLGGEMAGHVTTFGLAALLVTTLSGLRGLAWGAAAAGTLAIVSVAVPVTFVSVVETNLPFPPLTYGLILEDVARGEVLSGLAARDAPAFATELPPSAATELARPFLAAFASVGGPGFVLIALSLMSGIACLPTLLTRASATTGVYDTRKAMGWTAFFVGSALLFLPAIAVFLRHATLDTGLFLDVGRANAIDTLVPYGLAPQGGAAADGAMFRDAAILALPAVAELPSVVFDLAAAGIIAVAFVVFTAHLLALGAMIADDVFLAVFRDPPDIVRSVGARVSTAAAIVLAALITTATGQGDPLRLMFNALSIIGGTTFAILILSIWWKPVTAAAAFWAMVAGFGLSASYALFADGIGLGPFLGIEAAAFGAVATLLSAAIALGISWTSKSGPPQSQRDMVRDLRVPGGEALYDRELRLREAERRRRARR